MLNTITVMGRLTRDPALRTTQSGTPVASFTLAVERDFTQEKQTDFIDCVAWQKTGEFVSKYFRKGQMMVASGSLQSRKWEDREGNKRTNWEINVRNVYFGEPKREEQNDGYSGGEPQYRPPQNSYQEPQPQFEELDDDGDLPF